MTERDFPVVRASAYSSIEEQNKNISEEALSHVDAANQNFSGTRTVTRGAALKVVERALEKTEGQTFSVRRHRVLSDLSHYIVLAQRNKVTTLSAENTDLLPLAHPRSTRKHNLTLASILEHRARWYTDDPNITDDAVKTLIASALTSHPASPEYEYSIARLEAMPQGSVPQYALVAAFGDGNSSAARRARAMLQRRDRKGRFAEMGGGLRALIRRAKGIFNLNGRVVAEGIRGNTFDMELPDGRIARVPADSAEAIKAYIPQKGGSDGYSPKPAKTSVGDPVIDEADLEIVDAPDGFREDTGWSPDEGDRDYYGDGVDLGRKYTDDAYDVIKFEKPNAPAKDKFEVAEQREGEGQNVIAMGKGKDGGLDPDLPVYFVNRRDGDDRPFGAVQSWSDVQALLRQDEPRFEKGDRPNPNEDADGEGPAREESSVETPEGEEVEGEVVPALRKPTRRDIRDFERRMKQFEKGKGLFPLDPRKDHLVADDGRVIDLETGEVLFDPRPRRAKVRLSPDQRPKDFYDFDRKEKYEPEGATRGQESPDYTDDPAEIAQRFDEDEIKDALRQSVVGNEENPATGVGPLEFEDGDEPVPAEALYEALKEQDAGADEFLDNIYAGPEMSVPKEEQDKLEEVAEIPKTDPEAPKKELPLLEGLDDDERAKAEENPAEYLPENKDFDVPEGYAELDKEPFDKDNILVPEEAPDGFNFDPVEIAEKYDAEDLKGELRRSLEPGNDMPGFGVLGQEDENGEVYAGRVPGEAIRDALQLQGEDTNEVIDDIYNEGREGQGEPDAQEVQDALEGENVEEEPQAEAPGQPEEDEEGPAPAEPEAGLPADIEAERGEEAPEGAEGRGEGVGSQEADLEMGEPHRAMIPARDLQPGDIAVRDDEYFVIEEVGDVPDVSNSKDKKRNRINVKGYYPGHKSQDRNWWANGEIEVIRNVGVPEKGDKDPLPKPELGDYGKMMKKDGGEWGLRDPEAQARYDADVAAHKAAVKAAGADFFDPTKADADAAKVRGEGDAMPEAGPFIAKFRAEDLQPGDIALNNHFKIVEIREGDDGKMVILGHYPGYGLQEKKWKKDTPIEVMRGIPEGDGPQVGEGSLHRPAGRGPRGGWFPLDDPALNAEHEERVKEAKNRWQAPEGLPVVSAVDGKGEGKLDDNPEPPRAPREPAFPAFQGRFAEMAREANGDWGKFKELVDGEEIIVFDFETTGIAPKDGNEPYQIAAYKIRNGEIVDKFVMYFNPGRPLKGTYAEKNAVGPDGGPLPENFFDDKPSQKEALGQFLEWAGENPLLVAQNVKFDDEVFRRKAEELGLDYNPGGLADTMGIAAEMFKDDPDNPGRKNLQALADYAGVELENWHNAEYDALATAKLFRALLEKAEANNFGVGALDVDARQAEYDAKMAEIQPRIDAYKEKLLEYLVQQALRDALDGKEVELDEIAKDAEGAGGIPEGPVNEIGALGAPEQVVAPRADLVDVEADSAFPDGRMKIVDENFYNNVYEVDALMRGEIKVNNLRPGDFVRPNRDRPEFFQVVSIRGGDEFGVEEFKRRVVVQNKNGERKVVFWNQNAFLDEVRRPKDRRALAASENEKTAAEEAAEASAKPVEMKNGDTKAVPVPFSNIKAVIRRDGDEFEAVVEGQNARGEQERFNANFREEGQARDWAAVVANRMNRDMGAARDDDEKSVAIGEEPANVNELPVVEQIDDLPFGRGENEVVPRVDGEEVVYNSKAKVIDDEGEVQAQVEEDFPNLPDALEGGRDNAEQAAQALADEIAAQREGLLLRSEGRGRRNLPPIPDEYRRQVYIRLLAGLYADADGNPLAIGDRVIHQRPEMAEKYGEGVVVGKVQGKIGGLQRKGVVYVDYIKVKYPNGDERKYVARFQRHVDPDVAKERFDAEPRINWMNEQEMAEALKERAKKPRKEKEGEAEAVEKAAEEIREATGPKFESVHDFNIDWFKQNGNRQKIDAGAIKEGDYIPTKGDKNIGRVVNVEDLNRAVRIEVEYPDGRRWAYRPMAKGFQIDAYRLDGDAPAAPAAPEAEAPEAPEAPAAPEAPEAEAPQEPVVDETEATPIPELPVANVLQLKQVKERAVQLARELDDKELPQELIAEKGLEIVEFNKQRLIDNLDPKKGERDARRDKGVNQNLDEAIRIAKIFGWFDEINKIRALRNRVDELPFRDINEIAPDMAQGVNNLREQFPDVEKNLREVRALGGYRESRYVREIRDQLRDIILNPDPFNPHFRAGLNAAKNNADRILEALENKNAPEELKEKIRDIKNVLDGFGDLPKIPLPKADQNGVQVERRLDAIAQQFEGLDFSQLKNGFGDWKFDRVLSAGNINQVVVLKNSLTGEEVVIKYDDDMNRRGREFKGNGVNAEEMAAKFFRDLGFAQPVFRVGNRNLNPNDAGPEARGWGLMEFAGNGFFGLNNVEMAFRKQISGINDIPVEYRDEILGFQVIDAIIGQTDRHAKNFMFGEVDVEGETKFRLVPIDNGLALFNGEFGKADRHEDNFLYIDPIGAVQGAYGNANGAMWLAKEHVANIGDDEARNVIIQFAERMRERAEVLDLIDRRANEFISQRAQWILDNLDDFLDAVKRGRRR